MFLTFASHVMDLCMGAASAPRTATVSYVRSWSFRWNQTSSIMCFRHATVKIAAFVYPCAPSSSFSSATI